MIIIQILYAITVLFLLGLAVEHVRVHPRPDWRIVAALISSASIITIAGVLMLYCN